MVRSRTSLAGNVDSPEKCEGTERENKLPVGEMLQGGNKDLPVFASFPET